MKIESTCMYCGLGCKLIYEVVNNNIISVKPSKNDDVNNGIACIKGLTINECYNKGRINKILIRDSKKKEFEEVSYEYAIDYIYDKILNYDESDFFLNGSGKITNEANYSIQKFGRVVLKTNNIDGCCSRLCHVATVEGLKLNFGIGANPYKIKDIEKIDTLLIIGSNPSSNYPPLFAKILERKRKGMKLIVIDVYKSETSKFADLFVKIHPGSEVVLINALMNYLIKYKLYSKDVEKVDNFKVLKKSLSKYNASLVKEICNIDKNLFYELLKQIINSKKLGIIHGMGLTQKVNGIENVNAIANLLILKKGFLLTSRGEINVQGVGDMLCKPKIDVNEVNLRNFKKIYKDVMAKRGKTIIEAFYINKSKFFFINNFNPALSLPALKKVYRTLKKAFVIQFESFFNETSKFANVIIPTPILIEREGTITNGERRVRFVRRVINSNIKEEWEIFSDLAKKLNSSYSFSNYKQIDKEIKEVIVAYKNVNFSKVYKGKDEFADKKIKFRRFIPVSWEGSERVSRKYPYLLVTVRSKFAFLTNEATGKSETLRKLQKGKDVFYISIEDAKKLKVKDGEKIKVVSSEGSIKGKVKLSKEVPKGVIIAHSHFSKLAINKIVPLVFDEETFQPSYKNIPVRIEKIK